MSHLFYSGKGQQPPGKEQQQSPPETGESFSETAARSPTRCRRPEDYIAEPGLVNAVNVGLLLDKPLLLTGEPGTGKSQLAYSLAWELHLGEPFKFETKSTSTARDLFYSFDTVGRFKSADDQNALKFLTYHALGKAILLANDEGAVSKYLTPQVVHGRKRRSVVLIDEVDKAPRDFPNDILNELEYLHFAVPEIGNELISVNDEYRPIVVITSNSEKDLPDAFLRRCIYYNLPFPDHDTLQNIVVRRLGEFSGASSLLLTSALELFFLLRQRSSQLRKNPATSELLDWLFALRAVQNGRDSNLTRESVDKTLSSLIKTAEDQERAKAILERWYSSRK
jgi:MoxR-like ATPase